MKKYKITTAKNAVRKGLVKVGDEITVKYIVIDINDDKIITKKKYNKEGATASTSIQKVGIRA